MKKIIKVTLIVLVIIILLIIGFQLIRLGTVKYSDFDCNAILFNTLDYTDETDNSYTTFEYNGRTYLLYGTLKKSIKTKNINGCVGYIANNTKVYTFTGDSNNDYLMVYDSETNLMNQPDFYRAIDTRGEKIDTPSYIDSLDYNFWK